MYSITINKQKLYDLICNKVDKIIKKYNPCGIQIKKGKVTCKQGKMRCCNNCFYLSNNGCTVKCLGCKFGFCPDLEGDDVVRQTMKLLKPLYILAFLNDFLYIRSSKKEILTGVSLTNDREMEYRNIYNAFIIPYFSYKIDRKLVKWKAKYEQQQKTT